jgi:hypothetical protein
LGDTVKAYSGFCWAHKVYNWGIACTLFEQAHLKIRGRSAKT